MKAITNIIIAILICLASAHLEEQRFKEMRMVTDDNYKMSLSASVLSKMPWYGRHDGRHKSEKASTPVTLKFTTTLVSKFKDFEKGQEITQWFRLENGDEYHTEEVYFTFTVGEFSSRIQTTMTQTCEKLA